MKYVLLLLVIGCAYTTKISHWPDRGPFVEVINTTEYSQNLYVRDGIGRELYWKKLKPHSSICQRWPFVDNRGILKTDSSYVKFFPWENQQDYWSWYVGEDRVRAVKSCKF